MENKDKKPRIILIIAVILIVITIIVVLIMGIKGILKVLGSIAVIAIVCSLIALIVYGVWFAFIKKQRFDPVFVNKQKLIRSGKMNLPEGILGNLFISGDAAHSRVKIGKIIGYQRIQIPMRKNKYITEKDDKGNEIKRMVYKKKVSPDETDIPEYDYSTQEQDVLIVKRNFLQGTFIDPMVIRVRPEEHTSLVGDVVIRGFSIVPVSEYFFINSDYLDIRELDWAISQEAGRTIFFEHLRDEKSIMDRAIGLDSTHKKDIEQKNLVDMSQGQGATR